MPGPTYRVSADVQPYSLDNAVIAIANKEGSGKVVAIKEISVNFQALQSDLVNTPGLENLVFISGHNGGTALQIHSLDSADTLPSQVEAKTDACLDDVTTLTSTGLLKRSVASPQFTPARIPMGQACNGSGVGFGNFCVIQSTMFASPATGPILREGEGIAWLVVPPSRPASNYWWISVTFKTNQAGNPTFVAHSVYNPISDYSCGFSLMNNTGSGVVLTIINVEVHETGSDGLPALSFIKIDGIDDDYEGYVPTVRKMDSNNPDIPSSVMIRRNCAIHLAGKRSGLDPIAFSPDFSSNSASLQWHTPFPHWYRSGRGSGKFRSYLPPPNGLNRVHFSGAGRGFTRVFDGNMILRAGEGVGVMCGLSDSSHPGFSTVGITTAHGNSSYSNFFINIIFTLEDGVVPGHAA